ncbi:ROK family transcriptional regulator [Labrys monachus]|uniref:NBD/HSP70 family sugar kinase n=1 Tax=Labrys monachus TaxID=217067 RepID=A0ABU0FCK0_9HYPH|nr:ROK family transcriptional regulator [Labrys monachus]MDQ0392329.1 putative NBD/HSP70 family sugar kinase [Labrys monachus]
MSGYVARTGRQAGRSAAGRSVAGTNLEHARSHNRRVVLDVVRRLGPLSRAEIARETALTNQTISNIVDELELAGFLLPGVPTREGRGQPPIPYGINPEGAWSLGFHVDHRAITGALVDLTGRPVALREVAAQRPSPQDAAPILRRLADELAAEARIEPSRLLGAGLALPVRFDVGAITTAGPTTLPGWDGPDMRLHLSRTLGQPVLIENDAMAAAIGERLHGAARDIDSFVFLFLDQGLGAGLFLGGQPWRGASLNAGEIGHMIVVPGGRPCPCGNRGCLERYVSLSAAQEFLADDPASDTAIDLAAASPERLERWIDEAAPHLAAAVNILESTLDPETILLGGVAPAALLARLIEKAMPLPMSVGSRTGRDRPRLIAGAVGRHTVALGAASLPIFDEINPRFDVLLKR